jgi:hypothetical protein
MKTKVFLMILALAVFSFSSCTKLKNLIEATSTDLVDDDAVTEVAFDDVFNSVDNATNIMENLLGLAKGDMESTVVLADSCPTITIEKTGTGVFPKKITINYGTACTGYYGNIRSGKIITIVSERRSVVGSTRTVTLENYFFNGIKMEGTKVLTTMPLNNQNPVFSIKLTGGKLTLPDGKTIERSFDHKREWTAGFGTPKNIWDDEYLITGTASGKGINGNSYTNTILTALHWTRACEFLVSGTIKFERTGVEPVVLDYGTGACDAKATLTRGEQSREITLRHKHRLMP